MDFEIVDFHTHPFIDDDTNICSHKEYCNMSPEMTVEYLRKMGISKICGSVLNTKEFGKGTLESILQRNKLMLELKDLYKDFYIPGFQVSPLFVKESLEEIEKMHKLGINLIGELCPYLDNWGDYSSSGFSEILDLAENYDIVVSFHSMNEESMDKMVRNHKNVRFVAAHPGEFESYMRHLDRMKMSENYYLDLSGTGLFRCGMLRRGIDVCGIDRFIFGSDYPTCNPAMFVGGILFDNLISDSEKEAIFSANVKRLLSL